MSVQRAFELASGYLRIGKITSVNTEKFRCDIEFPGTNSVARNVPFTPNPLFGFMPETGTHVSVCSRPGAGHRVIGLLDRPDSRKPEEVLVQENKPGTIPRMEMGDVYIGHRGRAYFSKHGDVYVTARGSRASLELNCEKAKAELYAYNFDIFTPGRNVRIRSQSTVAAAWGDSLSLEVNMPGPELLQTHLGRINIDKFGSMNLDVLPLTAGAVNLSMGITGAIGLGRGFPLKTVGLEMGPVGLDSIDLFTPKHYFSMDPLMQRVALENLPGLTDLTMTDIGDVHLGSQSSYFSVSRTLQSVSMRSALSRVELQDNGSLTLANNANDYNISGTSALLSLAGKTVDMMATAGPLGLSSTTVASIAAPLINLGAISAGHVAVVEALMIIFKKLDALHQAIKNHTHAISGVVVSGAGAGGQVIGGVLAPDGSGSGGTSRALSLAAAGLVPPVPTAAQLGSTTVTVQA